MHGGITQFRVILILVLALGYAGVDRAQAQAPAAPENTGPNSNILRWAMGTYNYTTLKDPRVRGFERFYLNVHKDGSRTMIMWHDLAARNAQFSVMLRVADNFRPIEAYLNYWTAQGFKGSTLITVREDTLTALSHGPQGQHTMTTPVPVRMSVGTHPVSADGWHTWYDDPEVSGPQNGMIYSLEATPDNTKPPLGTLVPIQFERIGPDRITVPAGTFDALKYKLSGVSDVWLLPQDRLLIRMTNTLRDLDYVLTALTTGHNALGSQAEGKTP